MRLARQKGYLFCLLLSLPLAADPTPNNGFEAVLHYGRHSDFWKEIENLDGSGDPIAQINRFFDEKNYGSREGVILADFKYLTSSPDWADRFFEKAGLGLGFHGLVGGEAYNRISPKLRGYALWDISFDASLENSSPWKESGWSSSLGSSLGVGKQKLTQDDALAYLDHTPIRNATLFYMGFDGALGYHSQFSNNMIMNYRLSASPTYFYSEWDDDNYRYSISKGIWTLRWKTDFEGLIPLQDPHKGGFEFGGQVISGQQPTPVKIAPRTWDAIHDLEFFPAFGSLVGLGAIGRVFTASRRYLLEVRGGYYGGYFGAKIGAKLSWFQLEVGSFGLEQTSGFKIRESRMEYARLGFDYDW